MSRSRRLGAAFALAGALAGVLLAVVLRSDHDPYRALPPGSVVSAAVTAGNVDLVRLPVGQVTVKTLKIPRPRPAKRVKRPTKTSASQGSGTTSRPVVTPPTGAVTRAPVTPSPSSAAPVKPKPAAPSHPRPSTPQGGFD